MSRALLLAPGLLAGAAGMGSVAAVALPPAAEPCAACHGENGVSAMEGTPSIAGQTDLFIQWQLVYFKAGKRQNEVMQPLASELDNAAIRQIGAYFAGLAPPPPPAEPDPMPAKSEVGAKLAAKLGCASCHKDDYSGDKAAPRIANQRADYLLKSLRDYKVGARSGGGNAAMAEVTYDLDDAAFEALSHYLAYKKP